MSYPYLSGLFDAQSNNSLRISMHIEPEQSQLTVQSTRGIDVQK